MIPGVAIATALTPPLCTAGYGLATLQLNYFLGAFYLFFINTVFIAIATFVVVRFLKYRKKEFLDKGREARVRRSMLLIVLGDDRAERRDRLPYRQTQFFRKRMLSATCRTCFSFRRPRRSISTRISIPTAPRSRCL